MYGSLLVSNPMTPVDLFIVSLDGKLAGEK
jgi:hypothetical protein